MSIKIVKKIIHIGFLDNQMEAYNLRLLTIKFGK